LGRLRTAVGRDATPHAWTYDRIGNVVSSPEGVLAYGIPMPDESDDTPQAATRPGTKSISYDDRRRIIEGPLGLVKSPRTDLPRQFDTETSEIAFKYDALGRRTVKSTPSMNTVYIGHLYERREPAGDKPHHVFHVQAAGRT